MNKIQQKVLLATATLVALMTLYAPHHRMINGTSFNRGYLWFFSDTSNQIDMALLLTQIFLVLSIGFILYLLLDKRNNK